MVKEASDTAIHPLDAKPAKPSRCESRRTGACFLGNGHFRNRFIGGTYHKKKWIKKGLCNGISQ